MTNKINKEDKALIKAYFKWHMNKWGVAPREHEVSRLIDNTYLNHRTLVEDYLEELARA